MKRTIALFVSASLLLTPLTAGFTENVDENTAVQTVAAPAAENETASEAVTTEQTESTAAESPLCETQETVSGVDEITPDMGSENEADHEIEQVETQNETSEESEDSVITAVQEDAPETDEEIPESVEVPAEEECETAKAAETKTTSSYAPITFSIGDEGKYKCVVTGFSAEDSDTMRIHGKLSRKMLMRSFLTQTVLSA